MSDHTKIITKFESEILSNIDHIEAMCNNIKEELNKLIDYCDVEIDDLLDKVSDLESDISDMEKGEQHND